MTIQLRANKLVLFERSPKEFYDYPDNFYHFFEQKSNTGLKMEFLQKYLFIPLDIFKKNQQNRSISRKQDAWLTLFSSDDPKLIIKLIEEYPEFYKIYEEGYEICRNVERMMEMFSKELYELDRNTVQYMIDEMQDTIDMQREEISKMQEEREKRIGDTIDILKSIGVPEQEIIQKICGLYELSAEQIRKYL